MKFYIFFIFALLTLRSFGQKVVHLPSLLRELTDRESVARWSEPYYTEWQASSYDRRSQSPDKPDWFANGDFSQYIGIEEHAGHQEHVMLDTDGPGAIVRFWLTTTSARKGILRIYFDGRSVPAVEIAGYDLMKSKFPLVIPHSSYEVNGKGGSTLYLPLPFARHCKITWEEKEQDDKPPRYYQINYRKYAAGTKVETFNPEEVASQKELIERINKRLWNPSVKVAGKVVHLKRHIGAGQTAALRLPEGAREIRLMKIKASSTSIADSAQVLRSTILSMTFDGYKTVWCPVSDFSGAGVGTHVLKSWYRSVTQDGTITSRWVMPYQKTATVSFTNLSKASVDISLTAMVDEIRWDSSVMYFHAGWKRAVNTTVTKWDATGARELQLIKIHGKGLYMGNTLAVFNYMHTWYGEGDQKLWRDNIKFPVEFGTGLEDSYNTSWAPVVLYQTPFANAPRADNPDSYGYNTFTRTRNLDALPFESSLRMTLELLGWQTGKADFATTIYWYGFKGAADNCDDVDAQAAGPVPHQ